MRRFTSLHRPVSSACRWALPVLWWCLLAVGACQSHPDQTEATAPPPVGHYEGTIAPPGQEALRAALDIRHPSPGHYAAELTVPALGTLSFVADTLTFAGKQLRLTRPARPSQTLALTQDGDFWRGTLQLDSVRAETLLLKRGVPTPIAYRIEELPQVNGTAWLFAPADTSTPGPALALLPDAAMAAASALWADALAREGVIVLVLPVADSAAPATEISRMQAALRLLRTTAGADTANLGAWACGPRAAAVAQGLVEPTLHRPAFLIAQNVVLDQATRAAFRELRQAKVPVLGLYGGPEANRQAAALRGALGGRSRSAVRALRGTDSALLMPGPVAPALPDGMPGSLLEWLQSR